jgi:tRNA modification GTPase
MHDGDTIAALATPVGAGAIAVLRLSGSRSFDVASAVFRGKKAPAELPPGRAFRGRIEHRGAVLDDVLLTVYRSPRSYTGEDVVEISGHGGAVVARSVLRALLESGARPAAPGEFTRRAFLNGKMDLTQAEAVMDLISARSEAAARAATSQLEGRLGQTAEKLRAGAMAALAHLEAFIDFPEEGIDPESGQTLAGRISSLSVAVGRLLSTADEGRMLREGVRLVIHGEPNVGKSSLLNLLLGYDRAMVSEIPGTTRDTIEENLTLRGIPFRVVDTAGLRHSADPLELEGMRRTRLKIGEADVAVRVLEAAGAVSGAPAEANEVVVANKIDLLPGASLPEGVVALCCLDGRGLDDLVSAIVGKTDPALLQRLGDCVAVNERHRQCLLQAQSYLEQARLSLERAEAPELTAVELRAAVSSIGEITGAVDTEDLLDTIFGSFCIGK